MFKFRTLLVITILVSSLQSCQKEVIDDAITIPNPLTGDSNYLDKMFSLYDAGTGIDTQEVATFTYDSRKRIVKWITTDFLTNDIYSQFEYYYTGNDSIPYKSVILDYDASSTTPDTVTTYHSFDASLRNLKDSTVISRQGGTYIQLFITDYSYDTGKKFGFSKNIQVVPSPDIIFTKDTALVDGSGNIISSKRYVDNGSGYEFYGTSAYTYDTRINPFARQWINKAHQRFPIGETLFEEYMPVNNITSQLEYIISAGPAPSVNFTTGYTYTSNGLPAVAVMTDGIDTVKTILTYKPL